MTTIAYDKPVEDLVAQLSATGHVTHDAYKKTSVTIHHNAGIMTHEDILRAWVVRPSSAHFDVDGAGSVAQYVKVDEYAWAVGNTEGNQFSISIEMCNSTLSPDWQVSATTWQAAARLAGWLFAFEIGARPDSNNFFQHDHWSATGCPGPYIASIWGQVMAAAQAAYDSFVGHSSPTPAPTPTPVSPPSSVLSLGSKGAAVSAMQAELNAKGFGPVVVDGDFGPATQATLKVAQAALHLAVVDGIYGPNTQAALAAYSKPLTTNPALVTNLQNDVHVLPDGKWGNGTDVALTWVMSVAQSQSLPGDIKALQTWVGATPDGFWGQLSKLALVATVRKIQGSLGVAQDGSVGPITLAAFNKARVANLNKF
jgi:peptidoglycan hydrolase-like protein with peptidoglycan-binding domain